MDGFSYHCAPARRRFPGALPVATVGYVPHKSDEIHRPFGTFNFSFILQGRGFYVVDGERHAVAAPAVITQWPGIVQHYGPRPGTWEELFLIYDPEQEGRLREAGFLDDRRRLWAIGDVGSLQGPLEEVLRLGRLADRDRHVDRCDRCCERLLLESLLQAAGAPVRGPEEAVRAIRRLVESHMTVDHDFESLALDHGLSPSHFRRIWGRQVGVPPGRYLTQLRLRRACRELVETNRSIASIARGLGFADPLYFARRFKRFAGEPASSYRQRYRQVLSRL